MKSWIDRRAVIFYVFALVCFALTPLAPTEYSYVGWILGITYLILGSMSWLDRIAFWRSHPRHRSRR